MTTNVKKKAKTDVYRATIEAKVRREDASQPDFELVNCYFPNKDESRRSLTRIVSQDQINPSRNKASAAMHTLHGIPSLEERRAYKLAHFNLSELVSDYYRSRG